MGASLWAFLTVFGLGVAYFVAAIPTGVAMHLSPGVAAFAAWAGYTAIGALMLFIGTPARDWVRRRFKISVDPDPKKLIWRIWQRAGLPGLALLAPVTIGPYVAALLALTLGEKPARVIAWIALGVVPWCVLFTILTVSGFQFLPKS